MFAGPEWMAELGRVGGQRSSAANAADEKAGARAIEPWRARVPNGIRGMNVRELPPGASMKWVVTGDFVRAVFRVLWQCVRAPSYVLLSTLEPLATFVLGALARWFELSTAHQLAQKSPAVPRP